MLVLLTSCSISGCTPLHWAASCGQAEVCELLLRAKADVNGRTKTFEYDSCLCMLFPNLRLIFGSD
jgi:ankyrin repeat protein